MAAGMRGRTEMILGRWCGEVADLVQVEAWSSAPTPNWTARNHLPVTDTGQPW